MITLKRNYGRLLCSLALALLTLCLASCGKGEAPKDERPDVALKRIHSLSNESKLIFNSCEMKVLVASKTTGLARKFVNRDILIEERGQVLLGLHPADIQPSSFQVDAEGIAHLTIPHCEPLGIDIDDAYHVAYKDISFFLPDFSQEEKDAMKAEGQRKIEANIKNLDLLRKADEQAILFFKALLVQAGYDPSKCDIKFVEKKK